MLYGSAVILLLFLFNLQNMQDNIKVLFSVLLASIFILSSILFSALFIRFGEFSSQKYIVKAAIFLSCLGWLSFFFKINHFGFEYYLKSVFVFYEPSHFAVIFGIFFVASISFDIPEKIKGYLLLSSLSFGLFLPNATMLVYSVIAIALMVRSFSSYVFIVIALTSFVFFLVFIQPELLVYYADRIFLSESNSNLSALVYLQGWQEAYKSIVETNGLGLGFQMAGTNSPSEMAQRIYSIASVYLNREDGSFLAAKVVIEFGVLGVFFVLLYLVLFCRSFISIRRGAYNVGDFGLFFDSMVVGFFVDMFVRSAGYFTLGFFMLAVAIGLRVQWRFTCVK